MHKNVQIYFVCLSYLLIFTDIVRCKPDYLYNYEVDGWLKLQTIPAPWEEAFLRCHYEGAVLASPLDKQLATALHSLVAQSGVNQHIFLGTHDLHSKGDFSSIEGVLLSDMIIRWGSHPKKSVNESCLTMSIDGSEYYTHTSLCTEPLPYICFKKSDYSQINKCGTFDNEYRLNPHTGSCYKVHTNKQTWPSAYRICASEGGYLVILNDKEEARIVKDMFPVRVGEVNLWEKFHVGLRAWGDDRTWMIIHGDKIVNVYNNWNPGEPDNYMVIQNVGSLLRNGTLDDISPEKRDMFVCEKSPTLIRFAGSPQGFQVSTRM